MVTVISKATYPSPLTVLSPQHLFVNSDRMARIDYPLTLPCLTTSNIESKMDNVSGGDWLPWCWWTAVSELAGIAKHLWQDPLASRLTLRHDLCIFTKCPLRGLIYTNLKTPPLPPPTGPHLRPSVSVSKGLSPKGQFKCTPLKSDYFYSPELITCWVIW